MRRIVLDAEMAIFRGGRHRSAADTIPCTLVIAADDEFLAAYAASAPAVASTAAALPSPRGSAAVDGAAGAPSPLSGKSAARSSRSTVLTNDEDASPDPADALTTAR